MFKKLKLELGQNIILIENFGTQSYFTCMKFCGLMIGNTSSGITEAASFKKYVINIGDRQNGRPTSKNVISIPFKSNDIISLCEKYFGKQYFGENIYYKANTTENIIKQLIK